MAQLDLRTVSLEQVHLGGYPGGHLLAGYAAGFVPHRVNGCPGVFILLKLHSSVIPDLLVSTGGSILGTECPLLLVVWTPQTGPAPAVPVRWDTPSRLRTGRAETSPDELKFLLPPLGVSGVKQDV